MAQYTDDDIRNMKKVTARIAADYLGISPMAVTIGMRNALLPIGFAVNNREGDRRYGSESWTYVIVPERLIAYKYGRINEIQIRNIESSITRIVECFEEMRQDLLFLLRENEEQGG